MQHPSHIMIKVSITLVVLGLFFTFICTATPLKVVVDAQNTIIATHSPEHEISVAEHYPTADRIVLTDTELVISETDEDGNLTRRYIAAGEGVEVVDYTPWDTATATILANNTALAAQFVQHIPALITLRTARQPALYVAYLQQITGVSEEARSVIEQLITATLPYL